MSTKDSSCMKTRPCGGHQPNPYSQERPGQEGKLHGDSSHWFPGGQTSSSGTAEHCRNSTLVALVSAARFCRQVFGAGTCNVKGMVSKKRARHGRCCAQRPAPRSEWYRARGSAPPSNIMGQRTHCIPRRLLQATAFLTTSSIPSQFFPSTPGSSPCANIRPERVMALQHARFYVLAGDWSKGAVEECRGPSPDDRTRHGAPADRMRDGANVKVACASWRPTPMRWRLGADGKGECLGSAVGSGGCPAADSRAEPAAGNEAGGGGRMDRAGPSHQPSCVMLRVLLAGVVLQIIMPFVRVECAC